MTRSEAVNWLINITADIGKAEHSELWHYEQALSEIREILESEPERNTGEWYKPVGMMPPEYTGVYRCSKCDEVAMRDWKHHKQVLSNFCPNCGADMREGQDDSI